MKYFTRFVVFCLFASLARACRQTVTTVTGSEAPQQFCSGELIFEDNFNNLNMSTWQHELTMAGGGNNEFQWYVNSRYNSYPAGGKLHIKPTYTSDIYGEEFLTSGRIVIPPDQCTISWNWGCDRQGTKDHIINPIRSARLTTWNSFAFKYGTLEIRAKLPAGDWIWPALWMMPRKNVYGEWPRSGEIDLMESRGNRKLFDGNVNIGVEQSGSTLHFGPDGAFNGWSTAHYTANKVPGFNEDFHRYKLVWTPTRMQFFIDDEIVGTVEGGNGFWARGGFEKSGMENLWAGGSLMAPFDQEFFIIMNVAVGGTNGFFGDSSRNDPSPKPWLNSSPRAAADFWGARKHWEPTWNLQERDDNTMQVDYVRVYAL